MVMAFDGKRVATQLFGFCVAQREHHSGGANVAANHALDPGRERDVRVRVALMHAIGDRTIVIEGGKYLFYRMKNIIYTIDIKECFLLSRKGSVSHILGGCR